MTLRSKAFLYLTFGVLVFLLVMYFIASIPIRMSREAADKEASREYLEGLKNAIENEFSHLDERTEDYADWDDTYEFMRSRNPDYIRTNFTPATFEDLVLNIAVFVDESGKVVYSAAYDLEGGKFAQPPQSFMKLVSPTSPLVTRGGPEHEKLSGVVLLPEGPLLVVSRPVRTSQSHGPPRGTVIFGRFLSDERIRELSELAGLSVEVKRADEPLAGDFEKARRRLAKGEDNYVQRVSRDRLYGYFLVTDLFGNPALIARVSIPTPPHPLFGMQETYIAVVLLVCGAFFLGFLFWLIDHLVLSPVEALAGGMRRLQAGNLGAWVRPKGRAELSAIASGVDRLLEELSRRRIEVEGYERACRGLLVEPGDWVVLCDLQGRLVSVSHELLEALGYAEDEMLGADINDFFANGALDLKRDSPESLIDGEYLIFVSLLKRRDGGVVPVEIRCSKVELPGDRLLRLVARDLSAEKELQDLRNERDELRKIIENSVNPIIGLTREGLIDFANASSSFILEDWGVSVGMWAPDEVKAAANSAFSLGLRRDIEMVVGGRRALLSFVPQDDGVMVYGCAPAWGKEPESVKSNYSLRDKAIVGALPDAALLMDGDGKVVAFNPKFEKTFGHVVPGEKADAVINQIKCSLSSPASLAECLEVESASCREEVVMLRDGRALNAALVPLFSDGDFCGRLFYFKEIQTPGASPPSLNEGLSYLELFADRAPFMVWLLSADGSYSFANSRLLGFLGTDPGGASLFDIIHPEDAMFILAEVGSAFASGARIERETKVAHSAKRVLLVGEPLSLPDGSFRGYLGTCEAVREDGKGSQEAPLERRWGKKASGLLGSFKKHFFRG
jgi:PAS domain S-box-containing protein